MSGLLDSALVCRRYDMNKCVAVFIGYINRFVCAFEWTSFKWRIRSRRLREVFRITKPIVSLTWIFIRDVIISN
jgi:hypothetical protein